MLKELQLTLTPEQAFDSDIRIKYLRNKLKLNPNDTLIEVPQRRSIDARGKQVKINYKTKVFINQKATSNLELDFTHKNVTNSKEIIIVGAGPAGLFAALRLIELGLKPIIIERGKDVQSRRRDLAAINKDHIVNPESNYCFGEGGAGTYSDGKLYTRSKKRGNIRRILELLNLHGASDEILVDAHPHIGTNKLPKVVENLREAIIAHGGEIRFNCKMTNISIQDNQFKGIEINGNEQLKADAIILATGHSARDIYHILNNNQVLIEAKPFALGVRIEHPQSIIDQQQYHCNDRGEWLPAASYSLVHQTVIHNKQRGVFSFCMCPGGFIVPSATANNEIVVNGMSPSKRNSLYANSGIVVAVELEDVQEFAQYNELAAMHFQASVEQKAWEMAKKDQTAPAQRMVDFVEGKVSTELNDTSYIPGLISTDMHEVLPTEIAQRLKSAFIAFGKKMKSYYTNEAQIIGIESRTSSPVRIPRDRDTLEHPQIKGLYPCGEGAGYAGGIVSAAMDGERVAEQIAIVVK